MLLRQNNVASDLKLVKGKRTPSSLRNNQQGKAFSQKIKRREIVISQLRRKNVASVSEMRKKSEIPSSLRNRKRELTLSRRKWRRGRLMI